MIDKEKENGDTGQVETGETCVACHQYFDKTDECDGNYVPLTRDEEMILAQMRELKAKVAEVKNRLKDIEGRHGLKPLSSDAAEGSNAEDYAQWSEQKDYLDALRQEWGKLDRKRQEAASFRMKILGHED